MIKISCYQTTSEKLPKAFCSLAEKCYYSKLFTNVITANRDFAVALDRTLWTYSRKHFIPHATIMDPLPEKQPIYISDKLENPNNANIIIFINADKKIILSAFSGLNGLKLDKYERVLFLYDESVTIQLDEIVDFVKKSTIKEFNFDSFTQISNGNWQKLHS